MYNIKNIIKILILLLFIIVSCCDNHNNKTNETIKKTEEIKTSLSKNTPIKSDKILNLNYKNNELKEMNSGKKRIGLLIGSGGIDDNSFNEMQYRGLIEIKRMYPNDIDITYTEIENSQDYEEKLNVLINERCNLIIASGWELVKPIDKIAKQNPRIMFVLMDEYAKKCDNVSSVLFAQNEGSFVVGSLAAMMSKTGKIGFIGGMDIPVIEDFRLGFQEGIKYIDPKIKIITRYISKIEENDFSGWENPQKAEQISLELYKSSNVDIIYGVAGLSGNGIIKAAKDTGNYVIGVDSDQDYMAKGHVLTSMMKRLDKAVIDISKKYLNGELEGGKDYYYNYKNKGVCITDMKYTHNLIPENILDRLKNIERNIINGSIEVTKYFKRQ